MAQGRGPSTGGGEQAVLFFGGLAVAVLGVWVPLRLARPPGYDGSGPVSATLGGYGRVQLERVWLAG